MDHAAAVRFLDAALDDIRALPGVSAAGIGKPLPLSGAQQATVFTPDGELPALLPGALSPIAQFTVASPGMGKCCLHFKELDDLELTSVAKVIAMSTPKEYIAYYKRAKGLA